MWPEGRRSAYSLTFDFDAELAWETENPNNATNPAVLSQGTYGAKVALHLILDLLASHGLPATFFVPGKNAERHPSHVHDILGAGHEVAHHGYTHRSPKTMEADEERDEITRGTTVLESLGATVRGYRSPYWDSSPATIGLLESQGITYSSSFMDDIRPYVHQGASIVELPVQWILDDAAHFWFDSSTWTSKISTNEEVSSIWRAEFRGIHKLGGACIFTFHPQVIGRPGRLELLDALCTYLKTIDDAWSATCADIATEFRAGDSE